MRGGDIFPAALVVMLLVAQALGLGEVRVAAGGGGAAPDEGRLPGSGVETSEALRRAQSVVVARDVDMGSTQPDFPGKAYYERVALSVAKSLKGQSSGRLSPIRVVILTGPGAEEPPRKDGEYIFFLEGRPPETVRAIKVLRATAENVREVERAAKDAKP